MTLHAHTLVGCRPDVLALYLKSLGVLRLLAEQADPEARACWRDGSFVLVTKLDRAQLLDFFANDYAPSPLVAPWNGGSGFYAKDNKDAPNAILAGEAVRFGLYRAALRAAQELVGERSESPKDDAKLEMFRVARADWSSELLTWLDAATSLEDEGVRYPALLGTGGNDGRLDFTNNFMQRLVALFAPSDGLPSAAARVSLESALFGTSSAGVTRDAKIGQFLPGGAGGANASVGFDGPSQVNPWDFILALEGALAFQVAAVRRLDSNDLAQASAPFAVRATGAGYASATAADESARGEQWMPLWGRPVDWSGLARVFREARLSSGRQAAGSAVEAAIATSRAGAARGIEAFQRFGYIERNGQANLAVPLGVWAVKPSSASGLVDRVEGWVRFLRSAADKPGAPASMARDARRIQSAMLDLLRQPTLDRELDLLCQLAEAEEGIVRSGKWAAGANLRPLPEISDQHLAHARSSDDPEVEIARSLAALRSDGMSALRRHVVPFAHDRHRFATTAEGLLHSRELVWRSGNLGESLTSVIVRWLHGSAPTLEPRRYVDANTLASFLAGRFDEARIARLTRAFMAIDWREVEPEWGSAGALPASFAACRLAWGVIDLPLLDQEQRARRHPDPSVPQQLCRGRGRSALLAAERRLVSRGHRLRFDGQRHALSLSSTEARRYAVGLLLPMSRSVITDLARNVERHSEPADQSETPTS